MDDVTRAHRKPGEVGGRQAAMGSEKIYFDRFEPAGAGIEAEPP